MKKDTRLLAFSELERITRLMLDQAECGDWEDVEALERKRKSCLSEFSFDLSTDDNPQLQSILIRVLDCDRRVMELARIRQIELEKQLGRLSHGRKAHRAYINQA